MKIGKRLVWAFLIATAVAGPRSAPAAPTPARILLIAGRPSHGPGDHEFRAGALLIRDALNRQPGVESMVASNGWPTTPAAFDNVAAVAIYADGGRLPLNYTVPVKG